MITTKYKPTSIHNIVGNQRVISDLYNWLFAYTPDIHSFAIVYGQTGIGKTLAIELIASSLKKYIRYNDLSELNMTTTMSSLSSTIIVIDDITLFKNLPKTKDIYIPLICVCNDKYKVEKHLKINNNIAEFKFVKPPTNVVFQYIRNIANLERINILNDYLMEFIEINNCDIRYILNNLVFFTNNSNNTNNTNNSNNTNNNLKDDLSKNIFETTRILLDYCEPFQKKYDIFQTNQEIHPFMIFANYVQNTSSKSIDDISKEINSLSDYDLTFNTFDCIYATNYCNVPRNASIVYPKMLYCENKSDYNKLDLFCNLKQENKKENKNVSIKTKEKAKEKAKETKEKTKEVVKETKETNNDDTFVCECGANIKKNSKSSHLKTKKHLDFILKNK
jgi:DNA polymerase III delta prime subunit